MKKKPNYGLDAPTFIVKYGSSGIVILILATILFVFLPSTGWAYLLGSFITIIGLFVLWPAIAIMLGSFIFKFKARDWLFSKLQLIGSEQVLDVGCGRGLLLIAAAKKLTTGKAHGIDLWVQADQAKNSKNATLENARLENVINKIEIHDGDMCQMPFPKEFFDTVISSWAIHNISNKEDRMKALQEISRVLKPAGKVAILDIFFSQEYFDFFKQMNFTQVTMLGPKYTFGTKTFLVLAIK